VVFGEGKTVMMLFKNGDENWSRNMNGEVTAVAVSKSGNFVVSADNQGNINIWDINGDLYARNQTDLVKKVAISPNENLVVATTITGLKYFNPVLTPIWFDTKNGSIDTDIIFSADGSTIITSGGKRVSSHTSSGRLNWMNDVSKTAILDIACSYDCSVIVVGTEDGNVKAMDRYGVIHWTYPVGQWINSVAVSRDASVVAAAGIDRNLYILDLSGKLQTKRLMSTIIHTQSIAVSPDGRRIVVADERALSGLTYTPDPDIIETVPTPVQVTTQYTYTPTTVPITERTTVITPVITEPVTAVPTPTKSPLHPAMALIAAVAGLALVVWRRNP
jgi:WD40 repeat protein